MNKIRAGLHAMEGTCLAGALLAATFLWRGMVLHQAIHASGSS
jgi:hypothetical protein